MERVGVFRTRVFGLGWEIMCICCRTKYVTEMIAVVIKGCNAHTRTAGGSYRFHVLSPKAVTQRDVTAFPRTESLCVARWLTHADPGFVSLWLPWRRQQSLTFSGSPLPDTCRFRVVQARGHVTRPGHAWPSCSRVTPFAWASYKLQGTPSGFCSKQSPAFKELKI